MEKYVLAILLFFGFSAPAQKLSELQVPPAVVASFAKLHPESKKHLWEKHGGAFAVSFETPGIKQQMSFDQAGTMLQTTQDILLPEMLPSFIQDSLRHHSTLEFVRAIKTEKGDGCVLLEVDLAEGRTIVTQRFRYGCGDSSKKPLNPHKETLP